MYPRALVALTILLLIPVSAARADNITSWTTTCGTWTAMGPAIGTVGPAASITPGGGSLASCSTRQAALAHKATGAGWPAGPAGAQGIPGQWPSQSYRTYRPSRTNRPPRPSGRRWCDGPVGPAGPTGPAGATGQQALRGHPDPGVPRAHRVSRTTGAPVGQCNSPAAVQIR
jgi:hypothetical protein